MQKKRIEKRNPLRPTLGYDSNKLHVTWFPITRWVCVDNSGIVLTNQANDWDMSILLWSVDVLSLQDVVKLLPVYVTAWWQEYLCSLEHSPDEGISPDTTMNYSDLRRLLEKVVCLPAEMTHIFYINII
jgi:hypothetical protein